MEHLAGGCDRCWSTLEKQKEEGDPIQTIRDDVSIRRLLFSAEKELAAARLEEIESTPPPERSALLKAPRFFTRAVFDGLLDLGRGAAARGDLEESERWYDSSLGVLVHLEPRLYGAASIEDQWVKLWSLLGNLRRLADDFAGADAAFRTAHRHRESGTGDLVVNADLVSLEASLRTDQRRFGEAESLVQRAVELFLEAGDRHLAGRALLKRVNLLHQQGKTVEALQLLDQAVEWIEADREPRLALIAQHNRINMMCINGRVSEAREAFDASRSLYERFDEPLMNLRQRWLEGRLALEEGATEIAEAKLESAAEGFLERESPLLWALVHLDRAQLLAVSHRHRELATLTASLVEVFQSQEIHRETFAALSLLHRSALAQRVTTSMLEEVARLLQFGPRTQSKPS
ncbi:MAG: hypothetical protein AAGD01_04050 [Acidobacteriota bacterium]